MSSLAELRARQEEVTREWVWLHDAVHTVAASLVGVHDPRPVRMLHGQLLRVGERRLRLEREIAEASGNHSD